MILLEIGNSRIVAQILEKKKTIHDLIKRASSIDDPLSPFDSFRRYRRNGKFYLIFMYGN